MVTWIPGVTCAGIHFTPARNSDRSIRLLLKVTCPAVA
jgi:hypothetical protein